MSLVSSIYRQGKSEAFSQEERELRAKAMLLSLIRKYGKDAVELRIRDTHEEPTRTNLLNLLRLL